MKRTILDFREKVSLHRLGDSVIVLTSLCEQKALPANTARCL